ncbi:hypothetical protein K1719_021141 [Acacia pycnantha]|nr:hypothetical protein K1719_021141 [Acacia pycnantha]
MHSVIQLKWIRSWRLHFSPSLLSEHIGLCWFTSDTLRLVSHSVCFFLKEETVTNSLILQHMRASFTPLTMPLPK